MKVILILLLSGAATPALAQTSGGSTSTTAPAAITCTPEHAAMGHCKLPAPAAPAPVASCTPEHAAMGHCKLPAPAAPAPVASCTPEHAAMGHCKLPVRIEPVGDPHAGHPALVQPTPALAPTVSKAIAPSAKPAPGTCTPEHAAMGHCKMPLPSPPVAPACLPEHAAMGHCKLATPAQPSADPHAGHVMPATGAAPPPPATPPPAAAFSGPENGADAVYGQAAMAEARGDMSREHGAMKTSRILIDQFEARIGKGRDGYAWNAEAWYGGDIDKLRLTTEGEGEFGGPVEKAEVQALWSRALDPWFDFQLGVRQDFQSGPDRSYLAAGLQGLAPYWFEVEAMAFVSNKGEFTARFEAEYDLRLTQSLILQPLVEFDIALQDSPDILVGSGLSSAELGARLRFEIFPRSGPAVIAPYIGVQYERAFGDTARFRRAAGEEAGGWRILAGLRTWF